MNILLTSAGRRTYLVDYFRAALHGRGSVVACDMRPDAPALQSADISTVVPGASDPLYLDEIERLCEDQNIGLILPLNDIELPTLAGGAERLAASGIRVVVSSSTVVEICSDKLSTARFLADSGIRHPQTLTLVEQAEEQIATGALSLPLVVKPRWGSASIGIEYVESGGDLRTAVESTRQRARRSALSRVGQPAEGNDVLIQELVDGDEFHLDIVNDLDGRYAATLPKRKLSMRAGETDKAISVDDRALLETGDLLGRTLRHIGVLDTDVFLVDGQPIVLEMNPRFGGGYPFSHIAGANVPAAILSWAERRTPDPDWLHLRPGVMGAKAEAVVEIPSGRTQP